MTQKDEYGDGETVDLSYCTIERATYGPQGGGGEKDVTSEVKKLAEAGKWKIEGGIWREIGDPFPGVPKTFTVWYKDWTLCELASYEIKKETGKDIQVVLDDIPSSWQDWVNKTGINSLCTDSTWAFLDKSNPQNARKIELWNQRNIKKIVMSVEENPDPDLRDWCNCYPSWETGDDTLYIDWLPKAFSHKSSNTWMEDSGSWAWWTIGDEIQHALQLYQLPGKCFYKSDWLEGFEDVDPDGLLPSSTKKFARWFQHRHWVIMWYGTDQWGYNCPWTETPPKLPDGSDFSLDAVLKMPSMPNLKMPNIKLPSLPGLPSMPSLPSLPSLSAPSLPSLSMPSLSAPSLSMPSMPAKKMRPKNKYAAHGIVVLEDLKVKASGKDLILSNANVTHFWEKSNGEIDDEDKEKQRFVLTCTSDEQAQSWKESLMAVGVEEGDAGGCCTVA